MEHQTIRGRLLYTSDQEHRAGAERGREWFTITKHQDGRRILRAQSEIDDEPSVLRDIVYAVGPDWAPLDCFVRLTVGGAFMGTGWFRFGPNSAECETFTASEGRVRQRFDLPRWAPGFGSHALQSDAWLLNAYDLGKGRGKQLIENIFLSSPDHRGATGPMLFPMKVGMALVGEETVTVKAGTFDTYHFQYTDTTDLPKEHPPYDVWVTADGDCIFVKAQVTGYMQTSYELIAIERA